MTATRLPAFRGRTPLFFRRTMDSRESRVRKILRELRAPVRGELLAQEGEPDRPVRRLVEHALVQRGAGGARRLQLLGAAFTAVDRLFQLFEILIRFAQQGQIARPEQFARGEAGGARLFVRLRADNEPVRRGLAPGTADDVFVHVAVTAAELRKRRGDGGVFAACIRGKRTQEIFVQRTRIHFFIQKSGVPFAQPAPCEAGQHPARLYRVRRGVRVHVAEVRVLRHAAFVRIAAQPQLRREHEVHPVRMRLCRKHRRRAVDEPRVPRICHRGIGREHIPAPRVGAVPARCSAMRGCPPRQRRGPRAI